jgi:hypothetical protein
MVNIRAFLDDGRTALTPASAIGSSRDPATAASSKFDTLHHWLIYLGDGFIGRGECGEVQRVIKARSGEFYVVKSFTNRTQAKIVVRRGSWATTNGWVKSGMRFSL